MPLSPKILPNSLRTKLGTGFRSSTLPGVRVKEQFAPIIDHQVQFEAKEPAGGCLSSLGKPGKDFMRGNSLVETDIHGGGIDKRDPGAIALASGFEVSTKGD